jgi:hypothetical protein
MSIEPIKKKFDSATKNIALVDFVALVDDNSFDIVLCDTLIDPETIKQYTIVMRTVF